MARPIWSGTLSFGLLNVPVSLVTGERRSDLSFRMLDGRDHNPIKYLRVNAETGEEVEWKDIVKAYEYEKGEFVVIDEEDIKAAAPERHESIDVEAFVDASAIGVRFYDKPYVLTPGKKSEKGYVLLRETLARTGKVGIARVVLRTKEFLAAVIPEGDALVLMFLRFADELVDLDDLALPRGDIDRYRITKKEMDMAAELIDSMSTDWKPDEYHDDLRERLLALVEARVKEEGGTTAPGEPSAKAAEPAATNVVDFMALLEKSLASRRGPKKKAEPSEGRPAAKKKSATPKKGPAKTRPRKTAKKRESA